MQKLRSTFFSNSSIHISLGGDTQSVDSQLDTMNQLQEVVTILTTSTSK